MFMMRKLCFPKIRWVRFQYLSAFLNRRTEAHSGQATCLYLNLEAEYGVFLDPRSLEYWAKIAVFFKKKIPDISNNISFSFNFENSSVLFVNDDICKRVEHTIRAQIPFTRKAGFSLWVNPQSSSTAPDSKIGCHWKMKKTHSFKLGL